TTSIRLGQLLLWHKSSTAKRKPHPCSACAGSRQSKESPAVVQKECSSREYPQCLKRAEWIFRATSPGGVSAQRCSLPRSHQPGGSDHIPFLLSAVLFLAPPDRR